MDQSARSPSGPATGEAVPAARGTGLGRQRLQDGSAAAQMPCFQKESYACLKAAAT